MIELNQATAEGARGLVCTREEHWLRAQHGAVFLERESLRVAALRLFSQNNGASHRRQKILEKLAVIHILVGNNSLLNGVLKNYMCV